MPFLFTYWDNDKIILNNYNRNTKASVSKEVLQILNMLSEWKNPQQLADILNVDKRNIAKALENLARLKMVHKKTLTDKNDHISHRVPWDPIDLALQRQRSVGGRFPLSKRKGNSPSPIKVVKGISSFVFTKPQNITQNKVTLLDVLERRRSIRKYGTTHITVDNLSNFLYHSARIKEIYKSAEGTLTKRPYASGGARYPLEIYVGINSVDGIQKGIHYYDPLKHRLVFLNKNKSYQRKFNSFLFDVQYPLMKKAPDVVLIITAVFARTMWKYDKLGMSLILSDLGCLYQTMYLVATAMNLAPCPIGKTEEELVKNWLNLNWFEESHVGTFMLGLPED